MVAIRSHHKGGICSNQSAGTAQPTEVLNFTTAGKALWTQQAQQTLSFTFFFWSSPLLLFDNANPLLTVAIYAAALNKETEKLT